MKRIASLDLARTIAIVFVVMLHCTDAVMKHDNQMPYASWEVYQVIRFFGRIGVPIFLFITASLAINDSKITGIISFYKKRIPQFILVLFFYGILINVITDVYTNGSVSLKEITLGLLQGKTQDAFQLWYLYVAMGVYLSAPFLAKMFSAMPASYFRGLLITVTIVGFSPALMKTFFGIESPFGAMAYPFGTYFTAYLVMGYMIYNKLILNNISTRLLLSSVVAITLIAVFVQFQLRRHEMFSGEGLYWYDSLLIFFASSLVYALILRYKGKDVGFVNDLLTFISRSSFGIYLLHVIPVILMRNTFQFESCKIAWVLLMVSVSFSFGIIITWVMSKNKITRKLVM